MLEARDYTYSPGARKRGRAPVLDRAAAGGILWSRRSGAVAKPDETGVPAGRSQIGGGGS